MQTDGWVKVHRKILENPVVCKDKDYFSVWMYLLLNATHKDMQVMFAGKKITLLPGQLLTTRNTIAKVLKIDSSKVYRILDCFKIEQQIEQRTDRRQSLITIGNWDTYQCNNEQRNEQRVNNDRTTRQEKGKTKNKRGFPPNPLSRKQKNKSPKEQDKNERSVCNAGAYTREDTHTDLITIGKYGNVTVPSAWLSDFTAKYTYADQVIEALSRYKATRNIGEQNDVPFLESFAESDKDKYNKFGGKDSAMWKDESKTDEHWDEFFEKALERSNEEMRKR